MTARILADGRPFDIAAQLLAGKPISQVARENDLHPTLITRWKREYTQNPEEAFSGYGNAYQDSARISELERLVGQLYAEVDIFYTPQLAEPGSFILSA